MKDKVDVSTVYTSQFIGARAVAKRLWSISENLTGVSFGPLSNVP